MKNSIIKTMLSGVLLASSINFMLQGENMEEYLVSTLHSGWYFTFIAGRVFTSLLIFLAFHTLLGTKKQWFLTLLFISTAIIVADAGLMVYQQIDGNINAWGQIAIRILLSTLLIVLIQPYYKTALSVSRKKWHFISFIVLFIGLSFIRVPYISDFSDVAVQKEISLEHQKFLTKKFGDDLLWGQEKKLICFFSTSCPHCFNAARRIGTNLKNGNQISTYIVFPEDQEDIEYFKNETGVSAIPHCETTVDEFIAIAGRRMPSIFMAQGNNFKHWVGANFNYLALDESRTSD